MKNYWLDKKPLFTYEVVKFVNDKILEVTFANGRVYIGRMVALHNAFLPGTFRLNEEGEYKEEEYLIVDSLTNMLLRPSVGDKVTFTGDYNGTPMMIAWCDVPLQVCPCKIPLKGKTGQIKFASENLYDNVTKKHMSVYFDELVVDLHGRKVNWFQISEEELFRLT